MDEFIGFCRFCCFFVAKMQKMCFLLTFASCHHLCCQPAAVSSQSACGVYGQQTVTLQAYGKSARLGPTAYCCT